MKKPVFLLLLIFLSLSGTSQGYRAKITEFNRKLAQDKTEDTARINLLINLGRCYMFAHDIVQNGLDSARIIFDQALQLSIKLGEKDLQYLTLEKIAHRFSYDDDDEHAKQTYLLVIDYYQKTKQVAKEGKMWIELAESYHYSETNYFNETFSYFQNARNLYVKNNMPVKAAEALADMANYRAIFQQVEQAEKDLQQVLEEFKAVGHQKLQQTYVYLHRLQNDNGNYYRALGYIIEAIKRMPIEKDSFQAAAYYLVAGNCNMAVKKYEEAIEWYNRSLTLRKNDLSLKCLVAQCLIELNRLQDLPTMLQEIKTEQAKDSEYYHRDMNWTFARYHTKLNNNEEALGYYLKVLHSNAKTKLSEQYFNKNFILCSNNITDALLKMNQPAKAKVYLDSVALVITNAKTTTDPSLIADYYGLLHRYNFMTGNYVTAIKNLERQIELRDSLFTADKDKQLAELNIQYQTSQKEQAIKNLEVVAAAQQAKTEKANLQRNITILGILVMIGIAFLFYRNYQQKKIANKIITQKNELLQHLLSEKEWLLKEVHHRVKNNLHTVIGLLESQAAYLQDDALKANEVSKHRIYAMSLIHQQLYKTEDIKNIDMSVFLPELLEYLSESFGTERKIRFHRSISPIKLGVSQAIPIALIVNESVTNAIKYAFPADRPGNIHVSMSQYAETIHLEIADDGIGIDRGIIKAESKSMGMKLMKGLTSEIDGSISITNENGTIIRVSFHLDPLNEVDNSMPEITFALS